MRPPARSVRPALLLFLAALVAAGWFYNGANANAASRYDVVFSFCEPGSPDYLSFRIDKFIHGVRMPNTLDWARRGEGPDAHFYSNKAPGPALAAIPAYFVLYRLERALGYRPESSAVTYVNCWLLNLWTTVLPFAAATAAFLLLLGRFVCPERPLLAWAGAGLLAFGTLLYPFSTQMWGHVTAAAMVVFCLFALCAGGPRDALLAGLFAGASVLCDYSCAIVVAAVLGLFAVRRRGAEAMRFLAGGAPCLLVYMAYHQICFGNPFLPATAFNNPAFLDADAAAGMFRLTGLGERLAGITVSSYRGLFWYMPVLTAAVLAPVLHRRVGRKDLLWLSVACIVAFLAMNVAFNGWHGGNAAGPRYLIPTLPFFGLLGVLGIRAVLVRGGRSARAVAAVALLAGAVSVANMFVLVSVSPMANPLDEHTPPDLRPVWSNPLLAFYPTILHGIVQPMSPMLFPMREGEDRKAMHPYRVFNVGGAAGLKGAWQVVPPFAVILAVLVGVPLGRRPIQDGQAQRRHRPLGGAVTAPDPLHEHVRNHYGRPALVDAILAALADAGKDVDHLTPTDLAPIDQFHIRGREATLELARAAGIEAGQHVLDVGSGLGGSSRCLASELGCRVTGIDLTEEYCRAADRLTELTSLSHLVRHQQGDALDLPFPDDTFDAVWTEHAAMNIADKATLYREMRRVVKPGGTVAIYDVLAGPEGTVHFPVPWARSPEASFLATPEELRELLETSGLRIASWEDTSAQGREWFAAVAERIGRGDPPALGFHVLMGEDFPTMARNQRLNLEDGRIVLAQVVAVK